MHKHQITLLEKNLRSVAIGIRLRKLHDNLEKSAQGTLATNLVAFRASVIAIYGAILAPRASKKVS